MILNTVLVLPKLLLTHPDLRVNPTQFRDIFILKIVIKWNIPAVGGGGGRRVSN